MRPVAWPDRSPPSPAIRGDAGPYLLERHSRPLPQELRPQLEDAVGGLLHPLRVHRRVARPQRRDDAPRVVACRNAVQPRAGDPPSPSSAGPHAADRDLREQNHFDSFFGGFRYGKYGAKAVFA